MRRHRSRGLSLIEIVVVIAIISTLMAAVGVYALGEYEHTQRETAGMDVRNAVEALEVYKLHHGHYPDPSHGFDPLVKSRELKRTPKDPWGNPLLWALENGAPVARSLGSDGVPGGEGMAADVSSAELED